MRTQYNGRCSRRRFLGGLTLTGAAGLLGVPPGPVAGEPPPETTALRLARTISICQAPQYVVEALFAAEGFTDVQFVGEAARADRTLASGDAQMGMLFLGPFLLHLDAGAPLVILSGGHVGCLELFAHEPIRSVRDLKGRSVAVYALGTATHVFLATLLAYIGLDPRKDVTIVAHPPREGLRLFEEQQVDVYIATPPIAQELHAKHIGHVVVNTSVDRPWSQYFCCVVAGHREFVQKHPVACGPSTGDPRGSRNAMTTPSKPCRRSRTAGGANTTPRTPCVSMPCASTRSGCSRVPRRRSSPRAPIGASSPR